MESDYNSKRFRKLTDKQMDYYEHLFDKFLDDVQAFAEQNRLPLHYVEEEFVIDGQLVANHLEWPDE